MATEGHSILPKALTASGDVGAWKTRAKMGQGDHPPRAPGLTVLGGSALGSSVTTCRLTPSSPTLFSWATTSACFHHLHGCPFTDTI